MTFIYSVNKLISEGTAGSDYTPLSEQYKQSIYTHTYSSSSQQAKTVSYGVPEENLSHKKHFPALVYIHVSEHDL